VSHTQSREGTYGLDYHMGRQTKRALVYRLARRTAEVQRAVERYGRRPIRAVLDVGTADGLMLKRLRTAWPHTRLIGVDLSRELLLAAPDPSVHRAEAHALHLPFPNDSFDLVIGMAIIEHVTDPKQMVAECYRVLAQGALCIVSTPDPFFENIATMIGHLPDEGHVETFNLRQLEQLFTDAGFDVLQAEKFMMSPWGFPAELAIERIMRSIGLRFMLLNQLVVSRKSRPSGEILSNGIAHDQGNPTVP
jgi:ubiquinone/menaquinone biosynthesis C-methylase UbiE